MPRLVVLILLASSWMNAADNPGMQPFTMDHRHGAASVIDLSFLLTAPAGKDGFVRVAGGHLVAANGRRLRLWGVNITD